ncbi:hypothetical protein IFM89_007446 [Coptis chinensis]|uniref:DNA-directed RNA polymerase III subunit RPC4 n=1 Tax=Coptis chinensis TaxID=261450 RepID=A0A835IB91_9MAGN|nr:hypothetical protein IFM89_007446 [Coptis chinensis]
MDAEPSAPTRKVRFAPKAPTRRPSKPTALKSEVKAEVDSAQTIELLRRINDGSGRGRPNVEKKSAPVQIAFGQGSASSFIKSYGPPKNRSQGAVSECDASSGHASVQMAEKVYKEPWDYYSYYPVSAPMRRPYSGNPVLLDEEEFGEASATFDYDESYVNPAEELGLMDGGAEERILFLQLPASLPFVKRSASAEGNEMANNSKASKAAGRSEKGCTLEELPPGLMGKLLVYKSGAVKLKLGDHLYDVSPGSDCIFSQDVIAVNTEEKHFCVVGELNKHAVVIPDLDSFLGGVSVS